MDGYDGENESDEMESENELSVTVEVGAD